MNYKKRNTLVEVTWGDAWGSSGWTNSMHIQKSHKPLIVRSVGIVLIHDAVGISTCEGISEEGDPVGHNFIPAGMIVKVTKLD